MSEIHDYHTQLKQQLTAAFDSQLQTVEDYRISDTLKTPAILIEMESMSVGTLNGEGKTPLNLNMALHCILGHSTENIELEVRDFAAQVLNLMRNQYLEMPDIVDAPQNLQAQPGELKPGKGGFDSFVVTYEQVLYVGEPAFDLSGVPAVEISFSVNDEAPVVVT